MRDVVRDLKILFFDVGNVFVSDDPSGCHCYRQLFEVMKAAGETDDAADFFARRTAHFQGGRGGMWSFIQKHSHLLPDGDFKEFQKRVRAALYSRWPEFSPPLPGMAEVVPELARRYRLGIIANQPREVEPLLEERGLLPYFEVRAVSDVLGLEKPDPRIFLWALEQAGVEPGEALMIGDRVDNDIRPARALGMRTLWLRVGWEDRAWEPADEFEEHYARSLRVHNFSDLEPSTPDEQPDLIARSPRELAALLLPNGREGA